MCEPLVELLLFDFLDFELLCLARLIRAEIARIRQQAPAIQFDDARRHAIQKRAIVRDEQQARAQGDEQVLEPADAVEVEMVGRFVEQQHIGLHDQRTRQHDTLFHAAGQRTGARVAVEADLRERGRDARAPVPRIAQIERRLQRVHAGEQFVVLRAFGRIGKCVGDCIVFVEQRARFRQARCDDVEHGCIEIEFGLLRHIDRREFVLTRDEAIVGRGESRDDFQERRLTRAVTSDKPDALARFEREIGVIQQCDVAERELRVRNGIERHGETG